MPEKSLTETAADLMSGGVTPDAARAGSRTPSSADSTGDFMLQGRVRELMRPVYDMAEQAKTVERDRILHSMFGVSRNTKQANPVAKGVSEFLANRLYKSDIEPYLTTLETEMQSNIKGFNAERAGIGQTKDDQMTQLIASPDPGLNMYGQRIMAIRSARDPYSRQRALLSLLSLHRRWQNSDDPADQARLGQLNSLMAVDATAAMNSEKGQGMQPAALQGRARDSFRRYLNTLKFTVGDDDRVMGYADNPQADLRQRSNSAGQSAVQM